MQQLTANGKQYTGYELELLELLQKWGFERMDENVYRKDNIDILIEIIKHTDNLTF